MWSAEVMKNVRTVQYEELSEDQIKAARMRRSRDRYLHMAASYGTLGLTLLNVIVTSHQVGGQACSLSLMTHIKGKPHK